MGFSLLHIFVVCAIIRSAVSGFTAEAVGWNLTCNDRYGNLKDGLPRAGYLAAINFTLFQELQNLFVKLLVKLSPQTEYTEFIVNVCSFESSRRQNIFIRLYTDMLISAKDSSFKIKCPVHKGSYLFGERPTEKILKNVKNYIPSFVRMEGKVDIGIKIYFQERSRIINICDITDVVILKFT